MLICPKCGKDSDTKEFVEAFCIDCYKFNVKLPKGIKVEVCKRCNSMMLQGVWQQLHRSKISEYVIEKCKGDFVNAECDIDTGICKFIFEKNGKQATVERTVDIEKIVNICPNCTRSSGGYYEAIVQIRGEHDKVGKEASRIEHALSRRTFVSKIEEKHEGLDLFVGSSKEAAAILYKFNLKPAISRSLFGRKDGKCIYRVTYAVRV